MTTRWIDTPRPLGCPPVTLWTDQAARQRIGNAAEPKRLPLSLPQLPFISNVCSEWRHARWKGGVTMASRASTEWRYEKLTWPEINDAVELNKVCVVPC